MSLKQHLILIGPMGAGKSTIGRILSERLNSEFCDLDREIEDHSGASIPWIFDIEGEQGFRERESTALVAVLERHPLVIATGGGCVLREENRVLLKNSGIVIYLQTSIEQQLNRTTKDKNRPLLNTENPKQVLINMAKNRNPLYQAIADLEVDTNGKPPKLVVLEILHFLQDFNHENLSS